MCIKRRKNILNIDKLHATESTNDYLKLRFRESKLTQLHTVVTHHQTAGRGQMGAGWTSEPGKNLTFSVLFKNKMGLAPFQINKFVSVMLVRFLKDHLEISAEIKWPNDILSVNKKIAGVLIENNFKAGVISHSIIGIGLNVNQLDFQDLPRASSLSRITGKEYNLDQLLKNFLTYLHTQLPEYKSHINSYESHMFGYLKNKNFVIDGLNQAAVIKGVDESGKLILVIKNEDQFFDLKEVAWLY